MSGECSRCGKAITDWAERVKAKRPDLCFDCYGALGVRIAEAIEITPLSQEFQDAIRERVAMGQPGEVITIMRGWCASIARAES